MNSTASSLRTYSIKKEGSDLKYWEKNGRTLRLRMERDEGNRLLTVEGFLTEETHLKRVGRIGSGWRLRLRRFVRGWIGKVVF